MHINDLTRDDDVILCLVAKRNSNNGENVIRAKKNRSRFPGPGHRLEEVDNEERPSVEPEEYGEGELPECLVIRFSDGARTDEGVICGRSLNADIHIPGNQLAVSRRHCAITFDDEYRLVVQDLGSNFGPRVLYNNDRNGLPDKTSEWRQFGFRWPLIVPTLLQEKRMILFMCQDLELELVIPQRNINSKLYRDKVDKFRKGTAHTDELLGAFHIQSADSSAAPSNPRTAREIGHSDLVQTIELGQGGFGRVQYVFNLATYEEYVKKEPLKKQPAKRGQWFIQMWRQEADIMRNLSHAHIVKFLDAKFDPIELRFEYVPGGSLANCHDLTTYENAQILVQSSSVLHYLHTQKPPIAHRDVKPENILVANRDLKGISVKFADFGLAKAASELKTYAGTPAYIAPEVQLANPSNPQRFKYNAKADIWSLAVTIASVECGLPEYAPRHASCPEIWAEDLINHVGNARDGELIYLICDAMLLVDPDERSDAAYIHSEAKKLVSVLAGRQASSGSLASAISANLSGTSEASTIRQSTHQEEGSFDKHARAARLDAGNESVIDGRLWNNPEPNDIDPPAFTSRATSAHSSGSRESSAIRQSARHEEDSLDRQVRAALSDAENESILARQLRNKPELNRVDPPAFTSRATSKRHFEELLESPNGTTRRGRKSISDHSRVGPSRRNTRPPG